MNKFSNIWANLLNEDLIIEMARSRKDIANQLAAKSSPVFIHLVKYYYVEDEKLRSHWIDEIYSFLNDVDLIKKTKNFPTQDFILKNTYYIHYDSICRKQNKILDKYKDKIKKPINDDELLKFIKQYFVQLSIILSVEGYATHDNIVNILKTLNLNR